MILYGPDLAVWVNLVLATLLVVGAVSLLALRFVIAPDDNPRHATLVRTALVLLALTGLCSVLASVMATDADRLAWRIALGLLRGAALLAIWGAVIYDLTRYIGCSSDVHRSREA